MNLKIDLNAKGTFQLFADIESAKTLREQRDVIRRILMMFADPPMTDEQVEQHLREMSIVDLREFYERLGAAVQELKTNPL